MLHDSPGSRAVLHLGTSAGAHPPSRCYRIHSHAAAFQAQRDNAVEHAIRTRRRLHFKYPNGAEGYLLSARWACGFRDVKEQFFRSKGVLETARTYYKLHGPIAATRLANDDKLDDTCPIERVPTKRGITIDAVEAFFTSIVEGKARNMSQDAGISTLTSIVGRMTCEFQRQITWDEMLRTG